MIRANGNCLDLNVKYGKHFVDRFADYTGSAAGASRILDVVKKGSSLTGQIYKGCGLNPPPILGNLAQGAGTANSSLSLTRLPFVTRDAIRSLWEFSEENGVGLSRKILMAVRSVMFAITSWGAALALLSANPAYRTINQAANLTREFSETSMALSDYQSASELAENTTGLMKEAFSYSRDYYLRQLVKSIACIASWCLTTFALILGAQPLSMIAALSLSLATTIFAIHTDLYRESGRFPIIRPLA